MAEKHFVITIGREYGSLGYKIGLKLGEMLGINVYYKDLIELVAKELKMDLYQIQDIDETYSVNIGSYFSKNTPSKSLQDKIFETESRIIKNLAETESCIIVGHCASYILHERRNTLNVFIYAPDHLRLQNILDEYHLTKEASEKLIKEMDAARHNYYKHYTNQNRLSRVYRQIMIDSSVLGVEQTAEIIMDMAVKMHPEFKK